MKSRRSVSLRKSLVQPARLTIATVLSLLAARFLRLPETYWASISTMIVVQAVPDAALTVSWQRLVGTALGSATGALLSMSFGPSLVVFAAGVFGLGILCAALRLDRAAYRFAGITLTIVLFIAHDQPAWIVGIHRFCEVSVGILVGLAVVSLWPEKKSG